MANPINRKFTDEQLIELCEHNPGISSRKLAKLLCVNEKAIRERKIKLKLNGWLPPTIEKIPPGYKLKGTSAHYSNGQLTNCWVKTTQDKNFDTQEALKSAILEFVKDLPKFKHIEYEHKSEDLLVVYPLGDPHIGMSSKKEQTGVEWNLDIAEKTFLHAFHKVIAFGGHCKEALLLNVGDMLHYDNEQGITTRNHNVLDRDGEYWEMMQVVMRVIRRMIDLCLIVHEKVTVEVLKGNHDDIGALWLAVALKNIYENEPRLVVNDSPNIFHYHQFGNNLIGMHHGHTSKMEKLSGIMAADKYREWGQCEHRYWLTGHIHNNTQMEVGGCEVMSFRTLAAKDNYAHSFGWRAKRDIRALIFHKEYGLQDTHIVGFNQIEHLLNVKK